MRENPSDGPRNDFLNQESFLELWRRAVCSEWERVMSGDSMSVICDNCLIHLLNTISFILQWDRLQTGIRGNLLKNFK